MSRWTLRACRVAWVDCLRADCGGLWPWSGTHVSLVAGATDMREAFDGLALAVQTTLACDPFSGHVFVFRGRRGDLIKVLWWSGDGLCLFAKRLERGRFVGHGHRLAKSI